MKLLLVEDSRPMRVMIKHVIASDFAAEGEISECADGEQALAMYERERPDCVLMDIELPHLDGIKAAARIKAAFPEARIVMVTNYDDAKLRAAAAAAGAREYVLKDDLLRLKHVLRRLSQDANDVPNALQR